MPHYTKYVEQDVFRFSFEHRICWINVVQPPPVLLINQTHLSYTIPWYYSLQQYGTIYKLLAEGTKASRSNLEVHCYTKTPRMQIHILFQLWLYSDFSCLSKIDKQKTKFAFDSGPGRSHILSFLKQ